MVAQPPLTKICRQLRSESLPIFYKANIFVVEAFLEGGVLEPSGAPNEENITIRWIPAIGKENRRSLLGCISTLTRGYTSRKCVGPFQKRSTSELRLQRGKGIIWSS